MPIIIGCREFSKLATFEQDLLTTDVSSPRLSRKRTGKRSKEENPQKMDRQKRYRRLRQAQRIQKLSNSPKFHLESQGMGGRPRRSRSPMMRRNYDAKDVTTFTGAGVYGAGILRKGMRF